MISPNYGNPAESHVPGKVGYVTCMKLVKTKKTIVLLKKKTIVVTESSVFVECVWTDRSAFCMKSTYCPVDF